MSGKQEGAESGKPSDTGAATTQLTTDDTAQGEEGRPKETSTTTLTKADKQGETRTKVKTK